MQISKSKSKLIAILIHILLWVIFAVTVLLYQPLSSDVEMPVEFWIKQAIVIAMLVTAYYVNSNLLVPRFLLKEHTGKYFLFLVPIIIFILLINNYADRWLHMGQAMDAAFHKHFLAEAANSKRPHRGHRPGGHRGGIDWNVIMLTMVALVLGISTSITAIQKWQKDLQLRLELEQDKVSSELSFLKAQINPHFFFNTLNNIYALTLINAETSRQAIHQLSRMMRYILYETQHEQTLLSQEIAFVKDYISLMQLRLTSVAKLNFQSPEPLQDRPIAPMLFLPFIENAFKHGISATQASFIEIVFTQDGDTLQLTVRNSVIKDNSISLDHSGIGLSNTRRRLDLLYPGKYTLSTNELTATNEYVVDLILNLA
jgi:sensor histidine kinase YesM